MIRLEAMKVVCIVDRRLTSAVAEELERMGVGGYFAEHGKQVSVRTRRGLFGPHTVLSEAPSDIIRFHLPRGRETDAMVRVAAAADLFLPGRGSLFAQPVTLFLPGEPPKEKLSLELPAWASRVPLKTSPHDLIWCVVQRGRASELAFALLDMGLCVPTVCYGEGMGLRDRLGLLRITIPRDKEVLMAIVPSADSDFVMDVMVRKARLREPGRGYLCRSRVNALVTNTQMYRDPRRHVASMEQVISTLDMLRGSTDWRRLPYAGGRTAGSHARRLARLSLICEEGASEKPLAVALNAGAGGATKSLMLRQMTGAETGGEDGGEWFTRGATASHARERCDLVVPRELSRAIEGKLAESGFFDAPARGIAEVSQVFDAVSGSSK
jgi:hypothetical protein